MPVLTPSYDGGYITSLLWASLTLSVKWAELSGESEKSQDASPTLRETYPVRSGIGPRYRYFLNVPPVILKCTSLLRTNSLDQCYF